MLHLVVQTLLFIFYPIYRPECLLGLHLGLTLLRLNDFFNDNSVRFKSFSSNKTMFKSHFVRIKSFSPNKMELNYTQFSNYT